MRYEETHPWITFKLDMRRFDYTTWIKLGEASAKCNSIAGVPLKPAVMEEFLKNYLVKGALGTTAIEGNTLSEEEVADLLGEKMELPPSKKYLGQEIDNIVGAYNEIVEQLDNGEDGDVLSVNKLKHFNYKVLKDLEFQEGVVPGEIRKRRVWVGSYKAVEAGECEFLLQKLCAWLNDDAFKSKENPIIFGIIAAVLAHLYIAWIHPFGDGDGRTARLTEFYLLVKAGVPLTAAHILSDHYNQTRTKYYVELEKASKSGGGVIPFIRYALQGFLDGLNEQKTRIRHELWNVSWVNYVHEVFHDNPSSLTQRRRMLVLELSNRYGDQFVEMGEILNLSPKLSFEYGKVGSRTISRDIEELIKLDLLEKKKKKVRARKEKILAFLPWRA